ncbi:hypothetical protein ElyMa_002915700 [Elysia marginata]|uniref:Uncharacterized protein n=1 Tax=Elysia marginata TaxID=1093978 RepID=A0AAV4I2W4_9GAST|nr:hypothetical protein ElyMa_002915700 [Elysia marginata]
MSPTTENQYRSHSNGWMPMKKTPDIYMMRRDLLSSCIGQLCHAALSAGFRSHLSHPVISDNHPYEADHCI